MTPRLCRRATMRMAHPELGTCPSSPSRKILLLSVAPLLALAFSATPRAHADTYSFAINGSGITSSGEIQVSNTGPLGAFTVTGITGSFADANNGISGAITGLEFAPPPTFNAPPAPPNTFGAPAFTQAGFSYDNLFWPAGNSPAICKDALAFFGGVTDIYGWAFDVAGGYTVNLWSDGNLGGYQIGDALGAVKLGPPQPEGVGYAVNVATAPTPEPFSLLLLGSGIPGVVAAWKRRSKAVA